MTVFPQVLVNVRGVERTRATDPDVASAVAGGISASRRRPARRPRAVGDRPMVRVMVEAASQDDAQRIAEELADVVRG